MNSTTDCTDKKMIRMSESFPIHAIGVIRVELHELV
jgi:hypothetical protein